MNSYAWRGPRGAGKRTLLLQHLEAHAASLGLPFTVKTGTWYLSKPSGGTNADPDDEEGGDAGKSIPFEESALHIGFDVARMSMSDKLFLQTILPKWTGQQDVTLMGSGLSTRYLVLYHAHYLTDESVLQLQEALEQCANFGILLTTELPICLRLRDFCLDIPVRSCRVEAGLATPAPVRSSASASASAVAASAVAASASASASASAVAASAVAASAVAASAVAASAVAASAVAASAVAPLGQLQGRADGTVLGQLQRGSAVATSAEDHLLATYVQKAGLPTADVWRTFFRETAEAWSKPWTPKRVQEIRDWIYVCLQRNLRWTDMIAYWMETIHDLDLEGEQKRTLYRILAEAEAGSGWMLVPSYRIPILWEAVQAKLAQAFQATPATSA
jgi:hypothetical protein